VKLCVPTARAEVVNVATPELRVPVPKVVTPSLKVTVPEGVPEPGAAALTVAVRVTVWPKTDGLTDEPSAVVVLSRLTVCVTGEAVLSLVSKLASPP
jgi:hypothetical protein